MKKTLSVTLSALLGIGMVNAASLNLDLDHITVSGLSSGGYMANQFHLAHSDWVNGAAIISAGPYGCARNDITIALAECVDKTSEDTNLDALNEQAANLAKNGKIPALDNLSGDKVWLLHGTRDTRIAAGVTDMLARQYQGWVGEQNMQYIANKPFAHVYPTKQSGDNCQSSQSPFIGNCDYDAAGESLQFLYGELNPPATELSGDIITLNQHKVAGSDADTLAETGYAYVPQSCADGEKCRVHVSFHGCNQYADAVGTAYVEQTGINQWADTNQLVVVYPQTRKSLFMPLNPQGCWDWWGYTNKHYATTKGPQIKAVEAIVRSLNTQ